MSAATPDRLYNLLPALYRVRDSAQGEPLRALLAILQNELDAVEADVAGLYENWFIETCEEWVVPYIGDLLGVRGLKPISGGTFTARPYVAHTLGYRRKKGTAAMLEQLARDVTNWPSRVVEFFQFLDITQYLNHLRPQNEITPDLRDTNALELLGGPFEQANRTLEVRSVTSNRGRYNVPNLGIFLWRLESYPIEHSTARPVTDGSDGRYRFNPLGLDVPLFNQPGTLAEGARVTGEQQVPGMLRRRALYDDLEALRQGIVDKNPMSSAYFGANPVVSISVAGTPITPEQIVICDLSDQPSPPGSWPQPPASEQYIPASGGGAVTLPIAVSVDPLLGRLAFAAPPFPSVPGQVLVSYSYGFSGNLGGGPYDRSDSLPAIPAGQPLWQVAVTKELAADNSQIFATLTDALTNTTTGWNTQPPGTFGIIAMLDGQTYAESPAITIPENSQLLIVAADWPALRGENAAPLVLEPANVRPHVLGSLQVTGTAAATSPAPGALVLNGVLLEGSLTVEPGNLGGLQLVHCTLVPQGGGVQAIAQLQTPHPAAILAPIPINGPVRPPIPILILRITTTSPLPPATVGAAYSKAFTAIGGAGFTWDAGGLPPWLNMSGNGILTGTPPAAGAVAFTVTVTDDAGLSRSGSFSLPVNAALAIATASPLPSATAGVAFSQTLAATGGTAVYSWSATGLPAWLTLSPAGVLAGTPPVTGSFAFTATATDSAGATQSAAFTLSVNPPLAIATASPLPAATAGAAFSMTFAATGGNGVYSWSATGLPSWLTLSAAGVLTGTPPAAGSASFTVTVTDSSSATQSAAFTLSLNPPLVITTTSPLPTATAGVLLSLTLAATGGNGVYTWSATGLPGWLTLTAAGVLTGTPPSAGSATFTVTVDDSSGAVRSAALTLPLNAPLTITTASPLPPATLGTSYNQTLTAAGGAGGFKWSAVGLPPWLTLSANGVLTGSPPALGSAAFTVTVTDSSGLNKTGAFALTVSPPPLAITTAQLPGAATNVPYSQVLAGTGGASPLAWSVTAGSLPPGLALNASSGAISGTPSATGTFTFSVQLSDSAASTPAVRQFAIVVISGLSITTATVLPGVTTGAAYSQALGAAGGTSPLTWSISAGALPAGLSLNAATGAIAGTPSAVGPFNFTAKVTDGASAVATKAFTITIAPAPGITSTSLPNGTVSAAYSQVLAVTGGTAPYAWSVSAGSLPPGIALDSATGTLSGTPSSSGNFTFTAQVKDGSSVAASQKLTIAIAATLAIVTAPALPRGTAGTAYSLTLATTGGTSPFVWAVSSGSLPAGVSLSPAGVVSGTPGGPASATFTAQVKDAAGAIAAATFTLTIAPPLVISTPVMLPGEATVTYSRGLTASGGTPPYSWSVTAGALPAGLTLAPNGVISGTPAAAGASTFTVEAADSNSVTATQVFTLTIAAVLGIATQPALANGEAGANYSVNVAVNGGLPPYNWTVTAGALPPGLKLSAAGVTGALRGVPAAAGTFTFTLTATDSGGASSSRQFTIVVIDNNPMLAVSLNRTICGPLALSAAAQLSAVDSIIDGAGGVAIMAPAADAVIQTSTVLGSIGSASSSGVRTLQAGNCILTGPVFVERRQTGCVRFSYVAKDSRTPRRYRCQPDLALTDLNDLRAQAAVRARLMPVFTSMVYGQPGYAQLSLACAPEISAGADDGSEMGAFDFIKQPQRGDNLRASLEEYLRFGLEAGIFFVT